MALTREAITRSVFERLDLSKATSAKAVEATFEIIKKTLEAGEDVLTTGFGKFCVKDKGKRRGRNPQTGKRLMLAERRIVTFKGSTVVKAKLNGGEGCPLVGMASSQKAGFMLLIWRSSRPLFKETMRNVLLKGGKGTNIKRGGGPVY